MINPLVKIDESAIHPVFSPSSGSAASIDSFENDIDSLLGALGGVLRNLDRKV